MISDATAATLDKVLANREVGVCAHNSTLTTAIILSRLPERRDRLNPWLKALNQQDNLLYKNLREAN